MRKFILFLSIFATSIISVIAQTPSPSPALSGIKANLAVGEVSSISIGDNKISLKTSDGEIAAVLAATTVYKRVPPDNPSLKAAVDATVSDIGIGDKILVTGMVSADKKSMPAKVVYLMTKSDLSKKLAAEKEMWKTRGISGKVESVDFKTQTINVVSRSLMGETKIVVTPKDAIIYRRYSGDSIKFADAKASSLAEIKAGDQIRALGDKGADGLTLKAEQILTGSFKTVAGKVTSVNIEKNEVTIEDSANKKPVIIVVNANSITKKFPPEMARMMAMGMAAGAGGGMQPPGGQGGNVVVMRPPGGGSTAGGTPPSGTPPASGQAPSGGPRPGGGMRGGRMDLDEMINNFATLSLSELKVGDTIGVVTSSVGSNRLTAFKLLSGVEAFVNMPQMPTAGGRQTSSPSLNIPGLDGGF